MTKPANIINHIALILDASLSMSGRAEALITVADEQVKHLAQRSRELDQETRISIWTFSYWNNIHCVVWDMDVLRLPSIREFYKVGGDTAFIDATIKSLDDLAEIPERYGDHSFLCYIFTDGQENNSQKRPADLTKRLTTLPDHWTVAAMVPTQSAKHEAKRFGFPAGNIEVWDTSSTTGVSEAGERIRQATDTFMVNRSAGIRSTKALFATDATRVNAQTITAAGLTPLPMTSYLLVPVPKDSDIKAFVTGCGLTFRVGKGYYQLMKTEEIQANKQIVIVEKKTGKVFAGQDARNIIGLPDMNVKVKPDYNADYDVYVQSQSNNRKLIAGTKFLYLL